MESRSVQGSESALLAGLSVLIVEDDYYVANDCAEILRANGARVIGPVPDMARGRALATEEQPDCVLLDVNLKGSMAFDLAVELMDRGVPTIFTTGYDSSFIPANLRAAPCLQKPVETRDLVRTVRDEADARDAPR